VELWIIPNIYNQIGVFEAMSKNHELLRCFKKVKKKL